MSLGSIFLNLSAFVDKLAIMGNEESRAPWVLLAEDEDSLLELFEEEISEAGYKVIKAQKTTEAMRLLNNQKFSAIVTDLMLKDSSSEHYILQLRKNEGALNHKTPVILLSGKLDHDVVGRLAGKINGALVKPMNRGSIRNLLDKIVLKTEVE